jgi:Holliday junction resolvase RusA-like endonuclease
MGVIYSEGGDGVIELPYPDKVLSPNSRCHWSTKAKAAKKARRNGALAAFVAGFNALTFANYEHRLHFWIDIYAKTKNYPDADNMLSSLKSALDGIADALELNDRRFVPHPFVRDETHKGGKVVIRITKGPE